MLAGDTGIDRQAEGETCIEHEDRAEMTIHSAETNRKQNEGDRACVVHE